MTSSLTQQTQLTFNPSRFLPIDLSQPIYGGLYPTVSTHPTTNFNHFVQSTFFCKDLQDAYASATDQKQQQLLTADLSKTIKHDYGPLSDSDSCSNSSSGSRHRHPSASLSPNGTPHSKGGVNTEKKRKELVRDDAYYERRKKNNDAAKRSRDSRKRKEDEVAMRAALLEQENLRLRFEVERLKSEIDRHRIVALNSKIVADAVGSSNSVAAAAAAAAAVQLSFGANPPSTTTNISNH